jgi:hypothetical protein
VEGSTPHQNKKQTITAHRAEAGNVETPAPTARRKKKEKKNKSRTTMRKEVREVYRVSLGESARKEGVVVVVGTKKKERNAFAKKRRCKHRSRKEEKVIRR